MMNEYIEAFLDLGERKESTEDLRNIITVLNTTVVYMTQAEWERYQKIIERIPKIEPRK